MRIAITSLLVFALSATAQAALFNQTSTFGTSNLTIPSGISVDNQGSVFVTDFGTNTLKVFDASHTLVNSLGAGTLVSPSSVLAAPNGTLYVGDVSRVLPLSKSGNAGTPISPGSFNGIYQIAADTASNIFVTDTNGGRILSFTPDGTPGLSLSAANGTNLKNPFGVAVDASHIYVSDTFNNRLVIFDTAGNYQSSFNPLPSGWNEHPGCIAVANGIIFLAVPHIGFAAWSPDGQLLDTYTTGISSPTGIAVYGNTIYGVDAANHTIHVFQTPEPASLALLAVPLLLFLRRSRPSR